MAIMINSLSLFFFYYLLSLSIFKFHLQHSEDGVDSRIFILSLSFSYYSSSLLVCTFIHNLCSKDDFDIRLILVSFFPNLFYISILYVYICFLIILYSSLLRVFLYSSWNICYSRSIHQLFFFFFYYLPSFYYKYFELVYNC